MIWYVIHLGLQMFSHLLRLEKNPCRINFFENDISYLTIYLENFIDKSFKKFLDIIHLVKEKVPIVERKRLLLVLPYLGVISLQTRNKLQQAIKCVLNWCKLEIVFKCQTKLSNSFRFKDPIPKDLISGVVYKLSVASAMSFIMARVSDT